MCIRDSYTRRDRLYNEDIRKEVNIFNIQDLFQRTKSDGLLIWVVCQMSGCLRKFSNTSVLDCAKYMKTKKRWWSVYFYIHLAPEQLSLIHIYNGFFIEVGTMSLTPSQASPILQKKRTLSRLILCRQWQGFPPNSAEWQVGPTLIGSSDFPSVSRFYENILFQKWF